MKAQVMVAILGVVTVLVFCGHDVRAHDKGMHKQKPTEGRVVSVQGETFTLRTEEGQMSVTMTPETTVENDSKQVGREALKTGEQVAVYGTVVPGQGLVAKEVVLESSGAHSEHTDDGHSHESR